MIQQNNNLSYKNSMLEFFKGAINFTGYTNRTNHWFPISTILILVMFLFTILLEFSISSIKKLSVFNISMLEDIYNAAEVFGYIVGIITVIIVVPLTASFARRLRDVGFNNYPIIILIALFYLLSYIHITILSTVYFFLFFFLLMMLNSNLLETNKNDQFSVFMFRQTKEAKEFYSNINQQYFNQQNFNNNQNFNGQPFNNQQPFNNGQQFNNQQPFNNGQQFNNQQPFNNGQQFNNQQPFNNRQQFNNQQPFNNGQQFNNQQPFNNEQQFNNGQQFNNEQHFNNQQPFNNEQNLDNKKVANNSQQVNEQNKDLKTEEIKQNNKEVISTEKNIKNEIEVKQESPKNTNQNPFGDEPINK